MPGWDKVCASNGQGWSALQPTKKSLCTRSGSFGSSLCRQQVEQGRRLVAGRRRVLSWVSRHAPLCLGALCSVALEQVLCHRLGLCGVTSPGGEGCGCECRCAPAALGAGAWRAGWEESPVGDWVFVLRKELCRLLWRRGCCGWGVLGSPFPSRDALLGCISVIHCPGPEICP